MTHAASIRTQALLECLDVLLAKAKRYKRKVPGATLGALTFVVELIRREAKWFGHEERSQLDKVLKQRGFALEDKHDAP